MTKWQLFSALAQAGNHFVPVTGLWAPDGQYRTRQGIVQGIVRESGDGRSFNVRVSVVYPVPHDEMVFVRTTD